MSAREAFERLAAMKDLCADLEAAGYRILAPGEIDPETREACAATVECLLPEHGAGDPQDSTDRLIDHVRREDAIAIRSLEPRQ